MTKQAYCVKIVKLQSINVIYMVPNIGFCQDSLRALVLHYELGLRPGGMVTRMLLAVDEVPDSELYGIYQMCAHALIRTPEHMRLFVEVIRCFPTECRGTNFYTWRGIDQLPADVRDQLRLSEVLHGANGVCATLRRRYGVLRE